MTGALDGIRVLEFGQIIAGPFCGVQLADLGADVVKVEPPGGEAGRQRRTVLEGETKSFHSLNRGKRSLVVDLQRESGQRVVQRIIPSFDVVVSNLRFGVAKRLNIDYEALRQFQPTLIYAENTGFGTSGPDAGRAGSDIVAQAYSGMMAAEVKFDEHGGPELIQATGVVDFPAAWALAMGICAALFHRERTGEGQHVSSSLLSVTMAMMCRETARTPVFDAVTRDPMMERIAAVRARGGSYREVVEERGGVYELLGPQLRLYYGGYEVADGAIILGAITPANRARLRTILGVEDDPTADLEFDVLAPESRPLIDDIHRRIRERMLTKTLDEWIAIFDEAGVPASKVNLAEELADDPQVNAVGLMREIEHELTGPERFVGPLVELSATPTGSSKPSPPLDRHTDEVLTEAGIPADEVAALRAAGDVGN